MKLATAIVFSTYVMVGCQIPQNGQIMEADAGEDESLALDGDDTQAIQDSSADANVDAFNDASTDAGPFSPNPRLVDLEPNHSLDLGPYQCTTAPGDLSCARVTEFSGFTYDAKNHQLLMFGGGHATTFTDSVYRFDINSLEWSALYEQTPCDYLTLDNLDTTRGAWLSGPSGPYPRPISRHTYDELIVVGDELIMLASANGKGSCAEPIDNSDDPYHFPARVAHYDITANTWSFSETAKGDHRAGYDYPGADYDPLSGLVVSLGAQHLEVYDPVTKTEEVVVQGDYGDEHAFPERGEMGIEASLVYFPPNDKFYYIGRHNLERVTVWELSLHRSDMGNSTLQVVETTGTPPEQRRGFAYDNHNEIIGGGVRDGKFYAFHPEERSWEELAIQGDTPGNVAFHALAFDPINNVFFFLDMNHEMWAYRYR